MGKIKYAPKAPYLEGKLERDRLGWSSYVKVGGVFVQHWIWDRLSELPAGAIVRISAEVVDNGPPT